MGTLSLGYPRTAAHDLDRLDEWVYIRAPLDRYVDLTTYAQGLDRPNPDEQRRLQESYQVLVQTLNFEGMPYRDKRYLLAKHRQFQKRLAQGYYAGLH